MGLSRKLNYLYRKYGVLIHDFTPKWTRGNYKHADSVAYSSGLNFSLKLFL